MEWYQSFRDLSVSANMVMCINWVGTTILLFQDKTFGMKNKKGKKQQTYIKQVTNQVKFGGQQSLAKVGRPKNNL